MKIIVAGATGFVGSAVVKHCIANPKITKVVALSRRPLDESVSSMVKVEMIIHKDFSDYPEDLLDKLQGAEACVWAIGGKVPDFASADELRRVQNDNSLAAASAFARVLAPRLPESKKLRFVFCSGKFAEMEQDTKLYFMAETRKIKGQAEKSLLDLAKEVDRFEVYCARPSGILPEKIGMIQSVVGKLYGAIQVDILAIAMTSMALNGYQDAVIENEELIKIGRKIASTGYAKV